MQGNRLIDKIGVQGTLTASSSAFFCCLSALAAHNLQVISMRSLRSAKIHKGPGNQKPVQLVEAHTCLSVRLLRPRDSKNKPKIRSLSRFDFLLQGFLEVLSKEKSFSLDSDFIKWWIAGLSLQEPPYSW